MIATQEDFFREVCRLLGWTPTPWRLDVFRFWAMQESPGQLFSQARNPLATTWSPGGDIAIDPTFNNGNGAGNWNSVPVRVYRTFEDGARATARTLALSYYENVRQCFEAQAGFPTAIGPLDFTSWAGSNAYGARIVAYMNTSPAAKTIAGTTEGTVEMPDPRFDALNDALIKRFAIVMAAMNSDLPTVERAYAALKREGLVA